jgi:succinoglycan biosynthesis protein ExoV
MILTYYNKPNFGDAINPLIFNHLLQDFFDQDEKELFLGIGSILGLYPGTARTRKIIVFSSGYAYGDKPEIDSKYDIRCVRGPLTAKALNLPEKLAVTDGAVLLRLLPEFKGEVKPKFDFSFVPHHHSEKMTKGLKGIFTSQGINLISPEQDPVHVINQIRESKCVIAEAMHAAIIADSFRIPWIPARMFGHISSFKWEDWLLSLKMQYKPLKITSLFNDTYIRHIISEEYFPFDKPKVLASVLAPGFKIYQNVFRLRKFESDLEKIKKASPFLSDAKLLDSKIQQLFEALQQVNKDYGHVMLMNDKKKNKK